MVDARNDRPGGDVLEGERQSGELWENGVERWSVGVGRRGKGKVAERGESGGGEEVVDVAFENELELRDAWEGHGGVWSGAGLQSEAEAT